jgi:hypothetical protein
MIKLWVVYNGNKIVSWSTKQMAENEVEIEITEEEFKALNTVENDEPIPSSTL